LLKSKGEVRQYIQDFIKLIENQHSARVKAIRIDNGPEFAIPQFYASKGIVHQTSCVESPQKNGRVEGKHQHVPNVGRALLFQSKLPKQFWSYAILHATYIINRVPNTLLKNESPYFLLYNHIPNLHDLKVFGSLCYASTLHSHRTKLAPRARKCIFLDYKHGVKETVLLDLTMNIYYHVNLLHPCPPGLIIPHHPLYIIKITLHYLFINLHHHPLLKHNLHHLPPFI